MARLYQNELEDLTEVPHHLVGYSMPLDFGLHRQWMTHATQYAQPRYCQASPLKGSTKPPMISMMQTRKAQRNQLIDRKTMPYSL